MIFNIALSQKYLIFNSENDVQAEKMLITQEVFLLKNKKLYFFV